MAIFRCELSSGSRQGGQSAKAKVDYISRQEKYENHSDRCIHFESNIPTGFDSTQQFWNAADKHERANARLFQEFKLSLPIEQKKNIPAQIETVKEFIEKTIPNQPYSFAIHEGKGTNPHAHLVFSERVMDGVEREPEIFFKRANKKVPERGGAAKNRSLKSKDFLIDARESWATCVNKSLQKHTSTFQKVFGNIPQVDHRSRKERGLEPSAPAHLTKAIEDKIKNLEGFNDDEGQHRTKNDQRRLSDAKDRIRKHAISVRERFKENFGESYKLDRETKGIDRRIRKNSQQSIGSFERALQASNKELERAIEQSCERASKEIQRQRERSLQRSQRIEQQLRDTRLQSREIERHCEHSLKRSKHVAKTIERTGDKQQREAVVKRVRSFRAIEETCREIESFSERTTGTVRQLHARNKQTNRQLDSIGDSRSIKESVIEVMKKVFQTVKSSFQFNLIPETKHKAPGRIKVPGLSQRMKIEFSKNNDGTMNATSLKREVLVEFKTPKMKAIVTEREQREQDEENKYANIRIDLPNKIDRGNDKGIIIGR